MRRLWTRLWWWRRGAQELDDEIRAHLAMEEERQLALGLPGAEARRAAAKAFGNVTLAREDSHAVWSFTSLETWLNDLRYGVRGARRNPAFTLVAALSLALGIGAGAALFRVVHAVLIAPLPVRDPGSLVLLDWTSGPEPLPAMISGNLEEYGKGLRSTSFSTEAADRLRAASRTLDTVIAFAEIDRIVIRTGSSAEVASGEYGSGDFWRGLGLMAHAGRLFDRADDRPDAEAVVVLAYDYWQSHFGGSLAALGSRLTLNNVPFTVVGVAPPTFKGTLDVGTAPQLYVPTAMQPRLEPSQPMFADPRTWWLRLMGRRKASENVSAVEAEVRVIFDRYARGVPQPAGKRADIPRLGVLDGSRGLMDRRGQFSPSLAVLAALAGLGLLAACANVTGLLLSRGVARAQEMSMRLALGASRWRLVRQLMTESVVIAALGAGLGLLIALWLPRLLAAVIHRPGEVFDIDLALDLRTALFSVMASLVACLAFGVVPALRATRVRTSVSGAGGGVVPGSARGRLGKAVVVTQIALALPLLVGSGLFVRTVQNLQAQRLGFEGEHVLVFRVDAEMDGYDTPRRRALFTAIQQRLAALPGVTAAGFSQHRLISNSAAITQCTIPGTAAPQAQPGATGPAFLGNNLVWMQVVGGGFFRAMQMSLASGRLFDDQDRDGGLPVAIANETFIRRFLHGQSALGRQVVLDVPGAGGTVQIVGVMKDALFDNLQRVPPTLFLPFDQNARLRRATFEVRAAGDPLALAAAVRKAVAAVDANVPVADMTTQADQVSRATAPQRRLAQTASLFGMLALVLGCIGLYGVMSYSVARRTAEIGLRMALGASRWTVVSGVLRESTVLVGAGLAAGILLTLGAARLVASLIFGLEPRDPLTLAAAVSLLAVVSLGASSIPARRASRVDPLTALRQP